MSTEKRQFIAPRWMCLQSQTQLCLFIVYILLVAAGGVWYMSQSLEQREVGGIKKKDHEFVKMSYILTTM